MQEIKKSERVQDTVLISKKSANDGKYASEHRQCVEKCNSGRSDKIDSLVILQLNSFICNETDFIHRALCYRKVYEQDLDGCESSNKCFRHKMDMINLVNQNSSIHQMWESMPFENTFRTMRQRIK
uniref:Uncharacterized protein n=1 Tax=Romanomermis culicivorax TaxID=13658 RepID=A0A915KUT4_ROMCU